MSSQQPHSHLTADGSCQPIMPFQLKHAMAIRGERQLAAPLWWRPAGGIAGHELSALAGRVVRLRLALDNGLLRSLFVAAVRPP